MRSLSRTQRVKKIKFYTDFYSLGRTVCIREIDNGVRKTYKSRIRPSLFVPAKEQSEESGYTDIKGNPLKEIKFDTPKAAREFANDYKESSFPVFGFPSTEYTAINELYPGRDGIDFDMSQIRIGYIDIETESENGWPDIKTANERVNALTLIFRDKSYVLGLQPLERDIDCTYYKYCKTEEELLEMFIKIWVKLDFDAISGWNSDGFDIPYMVRRIRRVLGEDHVKKLSPWGVVREKELVVFNKKETRYVIEGITSFDYLDLYKKFTYNQLESYKLDHVASVELGSKKIDYSEYDSMKEFYTKDFTKWVEYNVKDTRLIVDLEKKKRFLELAYTMCYAMKIAPRDVFTSVRLWDVVISNYLLNTRKAVVPYFSNGRKDSEYEGAFVKPPHTGLYDWCGSFDLTSLYPSLIITHNISPETIVDKKVDISVSDVVHNDFKMAEIGKILKDEDLSLCSNGTLYSRKQVGVLPELMKHYFQLRKNAKNQMKDSSKKLEDVKRELERRGLQ